MVEKIVLAVAVVLGLSSCSSTRNRVEATSFEGSWNIIEVKGENIIYENALPFLSFNVAEGRLSGNAGCNTINGEMKLDVAAGSISFGPVAATRMYCPDMDMENSVLGALQEVEAYEVSGSAPDTVCLTGAGGKKLIKLIRRSLIDGRWNIMSVGGTDVVTAENIPFLDFRTGAGRVFGNIGCNSYNASVEFDADKSALKLGMGAVTQMMCPDMEVESAVSAALAKVASFRIEGDMLYLLDAQGAELVKLAR